MDCFARLVRRTQETLQADLADAGDRALRLAAVLDRGVTADALLRHARDRVEERLLVRAPLDTLAVATAAVLVDQHNAVLGPLIDRLARAAARQAGYVQWLQMRGR